MELCPALYVSALCLKTFTGPAAVEAAIGLTQLGITKALRVVIHAFTFDHPVLTDMLIQAAGRGGVDVFVDKAAWQGNTGWIRERLALIDACPGACVYITTGHGCGRLYYIARGDL